MRQFFLFSSLFPGFFYFCSAVHAQVGPLPELLPPRPEIIPQQPSPAPAPEIKPPLPQPQVIPSLTMPAIRVREFRILGNRSISAPKLLSLLAPYLNRELNSEELSQALASLTNYYRNQGWLLASTTLPLQLNQNLDPSAAVLTVQLDEGQISQINFVADGQRTIRNQGYVRKRLQAATRGSFRIQDLEKELRFLSQDPLVEKISVSVLPTERGEGVLDVRLVGNRASQLYTGTNNLRSPAAGTWERRLDFNNLNVIGVGDQFKAVFRNTEGSNALQLSYSVPLNQRGLNFTVQSTLANSQITEDPFSELDIKTIFVAIDVDLSQVVYRAASPNATQLVRLGTVIGGQNSDSSVLDQPFPISPGANDNGETRIRSVGFYQTFEHLGARQTIFARSELSIGLGSFLGGTVNIEAPDNRFLSWRGDMIYLRRFSRRLDMLSRTSAQFGDRQLLSQEQFSLGGPDSIRGYRSDLLFANSGVTSSLEFRLPIYSGSKGEFKIAPFLDFGYAWGVQENSGLPSTLLSSGLGLVYNFGNDRLQARLDFGIPLIRPSSKQSLWQQDLGISFSIRTKLY